MLNAEAFRDVSIALATIRSTPSVRQYARLEPYPIVVLSSARWLH